MHATDDSRPAVRGASAGHRTAAILVVLAQERSATAEEISRATGVPMSAVYRHLSELVRSGLAAPAHTRGRFTAGLRTVQLAENYRREALMGGAVRRRLEQLAGDTEELAAFLTPSGERVVCVEAAEGSRMIGCSFAPGSSHPLSEGASAQVLLAFMDEADASRVLAAQELSEDEARRILKQVRQIRKTGYAVSAGVVDDGVWGVSVPVLGPDRRLVGAVATMAPEFRARRVTARLVSLTQAAALDIARLEELRA